MHRRPTDRVLIRPDTKYWIIKRNLKRVPPGSEVEICLGGTKLLGTYGVFKEGAPDLTLKSKTGFVIATSTDLEDLALLIVENEWYADGPEQLLAAIDVLTGCKNET